MLILVFFYYYFCIIFIGDKFTEYLSTTYKLCQNDIKAIKSSMCNRAETGKLTVSSLTQTHTITIDS